MTYKDFDLQEQERLMRLTNHLGGDFKAWFEQTDVQIRSAIRKYVSFKSTTFDHEDLVQQGWLILLECIVTYDASKGASFKTFLDRTLEHEIPKFVDGANAKVVVNPRVNIRKMKVKKMEREFRSKHGVDPTVEQLAEICGFSVKQVREALYAYDVSTNMLSLNNTGDDSDGEYLDSFQSEITGFEAIERAYTREIVANAIEEALTSTERLAVKIMFGFFDGKEHTNQEVADIMDLNSRQHANQIIGRALKKLRDAVDNPRAA